MFAIRQVALTQFKNYGFNQFSFHKKVIGICGANGTGKTNLLDAIYYLCFTKSYFMNSDSQAVMHGQRGFRISGNFDVQGRDLEVTAILRETGKKEFSVNGEAYSKLSAHIGRLPAVIIAPDDVAIITGTSDIRRKMLDVLLSQLFPEYLQQLINYSKILQQRNSLLKQMAEQRPANFDLLEVLDGQLIASGVYIFEARNKFLKSYLDVVIGHYRTIAQNDEMLEMSYYSQLNDGTDSKLAAFYSDKLVESRSRDLQLTRTTFGIHRDDLKFDLAGQPFKQTASQGQRKSLLFALKLSEFEMLQEHNGFAPLLLLDDVFEKLDDTRMSNLLREVCIEKQGQVFITDTHRQRLGDQLTATGCDFEILEIGPEKIA